MSKRDRQARERARQIVAAQQRAQARRRRMLIAGGAVVAVLAVVVVLVVVRLAGGGTAKTAAPEVTGSAAAAVARAATSVPADVLDKVGTGGVTSLPSVIQGQARATDGGKPLVLYIGAEYCPYCAAQRWPVVVALSRFGTFDGLKVSASAADDVYPNTPTLSFYGSTYQSDHLAFQGVETSTNKRSGNGYAPLQQLTGAQQQLLTKYNAEPFVPKDSVGSIPFIDYANQAVGVGASYSPQLLAGKTPAEVAAAIADPASDISRSVAGSANAITALLCRITGDQPGNVCGSAGVKAFAGKFDGVPQQ
jgi:hypothetical protein